jgi:hypothetical protein
VDDVVCVWACRRDVPSVAAASAVRYTARDLRPNSLPAINTITSLLHLILLSESEHVITNTIKIITLLPQAE